jgi:mRNA-degrading endonuclease YafQ of YafQ-DinJ toxin-antitoxin module
MSLKTLPSLFLFFLITSFNAYSLENVPDYAIALEELEDVLGNLQNDIDLEKIFRTHGLKGRQWYNVHSSDEKQFVWFRVFKVASGTIRSVLRKGTPDLTQSRPEIVPKKFKNYFKFAFVRNPWDRLLSCYFHKIVTKKSQEFKECFDKDFEYFVDYISKLDMKTANPHIRLQTRLIPVDQCDFIGKLDNLVNDLQHICDVLGIEMAELRHKHKTEHAHYSTYYTPRTRKIVAEKYKEDIETFGFEFETR